MLMACVSFQMIDVKHKECFIVALLPHIRVPLMKQKIASYTKDLELAINQDISHVGEIGVGMA